MGMESDADISELDFYDSFASTTPNFETVDGSFYVLLAPLDSGLGHVSQLPVVPGEVSPTGLIRRGEEDAPDVGSCSMTTTKVGMSKLNQLSESALHFLEPQREKIQRHFGTIMWQASYLVSR